MQILSGVFDSLSISQVVCSLTTKLDLLIGKSL